MVVSASANRTAMHANAKPNISANARKVSPASTSMEASANVNTIITITNTITAMATDAVEDADVVTVMYKGSSPSALRILQTAHTSGWSHLPKKVSKGSS